MQHLNATFSGSSRPAKAQPSATHRAYAEITALARTAASRDELFVKGFAAIGRALGGVYGALYVRDGSHVIDETWHGGSGDPEFWRASLQQFMTEALSERRTRAKLLNPKQGTTKVAFLATPIHERSGSRLGAISLVVTREDRYDAVRQLATFESLVRLMSFAAEFVGTATTAAPSGDEGANQALGRMGGVKTPEELAFAITNNLRNKVGCEQVALGLAARKCIRILSLSGLDQVIPQSEGVRSLRAAMEECLDIDQPIIWQSPSAGTGYTNPNRYWLHKQWHEAAKGDAVASIPLHVEGRPVAVLTLRRRANESFTPEFLEDVRKRVEPFAPALLLTHMASRGLAAHVADLAWGAVRHLWRPGRLAPKAIVAMAAMLLIWFAFGAMQYELTVPCTIAAAQSRHLTVPFDGVLESVLATAGDRVTAGQVLCVMDHQNLDQEHAELVAEIAVQEREKDRAMANARPVDLQLAVARQRLAEARLATIDARIDRSTIRAPFDGVLISGDMRQAAGAVQRLGDSLFEIAALRKCEIELQIPERDVDLVHSSMIGRFAALARPEETRAFRITRIDPHATAAGQKNVYTAEAEAGGAADWLRPGMEGTARIQVGRKPVWWVATHRFVDYLRWAFWL